MSAVPLTPTGDRQVMPDLDAEIRAGLRESILRFGVMVPIVVDQNGEIIDGHNRWAIASELNVDCPSVAIHVEDESDALAIAADLNLQRRHMPAESRRTLASSLRERGYSLRAIAGALDVHHSTVADDLRESAGAEANLPLSDRPTVASEAPAEPPRVIGQDGREQPAHRRGPWSPDELLQLLDRIDSGESRDDLATEHGISRSNLGSLLTRARKLQKGETPSEKLARLSENVRIEQITDLAAQALTSRQIAGRLGISFEQVRNISNRNGIEIHADKVVGKTRKHDSTRVLADIVVALEADVMSIDLIDLTELDPTQVADWATSISDSLRALTRFSKRLKEMTRD